MIKVISKEGEGIRLETSDGSIFFIKENEKDLQISAEPSTIISWKGKQFENNLKLEDVILNFRVGQSISKFYELDDLLDGK